MKKIKDIGAILRPLSKREKVLIMVLIYTIIFSLSFKFIVLPQKTKIDKAQNIKQNCRDEILRYNKVLSKEGSIRKELEILKGKKDRIISDYFSALNHSSILSMLNDLMDDEEFYISDLKFSESANLIDEDLDIQELEILVPFQSTYDGISRVIRSISNSPKKIILDNLSLNSGNANILSGYMSLKIYSLAQQVGSSRGIIPVINNFKDNSINDPFKPYDNYEEDTLELELEEDIKTDNSKDFIGVLDKEPQKNVEILHEFGNGEYDFVPSGPFVKGNIAFSPLDKFGKGSLRFEYNILAFEDDNRAYIDLSSRNIMLNKPPDYIAIWVYSYGHLPGILGARFMTQSGENVDINMAEGIDWASWSCINQKLTISTELYPLKLDKIFYQVPKGMEDTGVLLIDRLDAYYPNNIYNIGSDSDINGFYIVQSGDTIDSISEKIYGTKKYSDELMEFNHITSSDMVYEGKILVFRRH